MNAAPDWTIGMIFAVTMVGGNEMEQWGDGGLKGTWVVECFWRRRRRDL